MRRAMVTVAAAAGAAMAMADNSVTDFGPDGVGGYPEIEVTGVTAPAKVRVVYATHPDGLGERGDFWHETRATYMGPEVWLPILPANTDRFDVFEIPSNGVYRASLAQGLVRYAKWWTVSGAAEVKAIRFVNDGICSEEPVVGSFACSDEKANGVWKASVRTCQLAAIPGRDRPIAVRGVHTNAVLGASLPDLSDGAKRDRLVWSGDLWWAQRNMYVAFAANSPYMPGSVDMLAENQTPAGYVNACPYPESRGPILSEVYGPFGSDEFAAWFVPVLADHYLHTGDRTLLARRYPNVVKLMAYLAAHQDATGLFDQRAETAKHSEGLAVGGTSLHHRTYMHLLLWRSAVDAARLATWAGQSADAARFTAAAARLEKLLWTRFYNEEKGRFILSLEQPDRPAFVANAAALAFGFATGEKAKRILGQLSYDKHGKFQMMAMRGAFDCRDGAKALALLNAHSWRMAVKDDWPGTHLTSECMHLRRSGWGDEAHPDTALAGVLSNYILGVRPLEPGYAAFAVDPIAVPGITWAKGRVPTPHGFIDVEWTLKDGKPEVRVHAPSACRQVACAPVGENQKTLTRTCVALSTKDRIGTVSETLYGGFVEHLGRNVYGGVYDPKDPQADGDGFRCDVIAAMKDLGTPIFRYPGGCFTDFWCWEDGIGPREKRPVRIDPYWKQLEDNSFGLDEFMKWIGKVGAKPMLTINLSTRGLLEAARMWEYLRFPGGTTLSDQRRANGQDKPYDIRYWCLGNELYGAWEFGHRRPERYGEDAREVAKFIKSVDRGAVVILCGSEVSQEWNEKVLEMAWKYVDMLSIHQGTRMGRPNYNYAGDVLSRNIEAAAATVARVNARQPESSRKHVTLSIDEYFLWDWNMGDAQTAYQKGRHILEPDYTLRDAVVMADLHIAMHNHARDIGYAGIAQSVNAIAPVRTEKDGRLWRQTIYDPLRLVTKWGRGEALKVQWPAGRPKAVRASAIYREKEGELVLFVVNRSSDETHELAVSLDGRWAVGESQELSGDETAKNAWGDERVRTHPAGDVKVGDGEISVVLKPCSWRMIVLKRI